MMLECVHIALKFSNVYRDISKAPSHIGVA